MTALREAFDTLAGAPGPMVAVHCLDLDGFKPVNDSRGHAVGDAVLCSVADRLRSVVSRTDLAVRTGGDEFVILQRSVADAGAAEGFGRHAARLLCEPHIIAGRSISVGVSMGFACKPVACADLDALFGRADAACYRDKTSRRDAVSGRGGSGSVIRRSLPRPCLLLPGTIDADAVALAAETSRPPVMPVI